MTRLKIVGIAMVGGLTALAANSLSGCKGRSPQEQAVLYNAVQQESLESFTYRRDSRTGLCFLGSDLGFTARIVTNVPCTPEVLHLIVQEK